MDFVGGLPSSSTITTGGLIAIMATGFTPIAGGIGPRIIRGAQPHFITAAGFIIRVWVGVGGRTPSGRLRGFVGVIQTATAAGPLCRRAPFTARVSAWSTMA